jgi:hypothetical protein
VLFDIRTLTTGLAESPLQPRSWIVLLAGGVILTATGLLDTHRSHILAKLGHYKTKSPNLSSMRSETGLPANSTSMQTTCQVPHSGAAAVKTPSNTSGEPLLRFPIWLWPNLLSLDAPVIAVAWYALLARSLKLAIEPVSLTILASTVWTIYAADRLLDVRSGPPTTARHRFARAHRSAFAVLVLATTLVTGALSLFALSLHRILRGLAVAAGVGVYFACIHRPRSRAVAPAIKQLAVSLLFAAGVVLPLHGAPGIRLAWAAIAAIVWLNIRAIDEWESTSAACRTVAIGGLASGAICLLLAGFGKFYGALALSAFLIFTLNRLRERLSREALRACVDLALLLPALGMLL